MPAAYRFLALWSAGTVFFAMCDLLWIGVLASRVYRAEIGPLLVLGEGLSVSRMVAALFVWMLISLSVVFFVLPREPAGLLPTIARGALTGLIIYGVYDWTNYAVLKNWTLKVTLFDIAWGVFACALLSLVLYALDLRAFGNRM